MTLRGVTLCTALAVAVAACSGSDGPGATATTTEPPERETTTTAPERPASTTTTAFDPTSVEGEVEAAYLRSWDVYADAVYDLELDEPALAEVYAEDLLEVRSEEIASRVSEGRAALVKVDHDYQIDLTGPNSAVVVDAYVNHQVLIDPHTKQPVEADPNEEIVDAFTARRTAGGWVFTDLDRIA